MTALRTQSGNDLHAMGNGGLSSVKAPAQPHPRTDPTIYAIPELEAALVERWESQAHLEAHSNSVHDAAVLARADELLIEPFGSVQYGAVLLGMPSKGSLGGSVI